jgi:hypothetical protein
VARGVVAIAANARWFSRAGSPFDASEARLADGYVRAAGLDGSVSIALAASWPEAAALIRSAHSAAGWWDREEAERKWLMAEVAGAVGMQALLEALTSEMEGHAESTYACALQSCAGDEALAKAASGAALSAIHQHALALLAGCAHLHVFMQKYALFAGGRFPLGMRDTTFVFL